MVKVNVSDELLKDLRAKHPEISVAIPDVYAVDYFLRTLKKIEEETGKKASEPVEVRHLG